MFTISFYMFSSLLILCHFRPRWYETTLLNRTVESAVSYCDDVTASSYGSPRDAMCTETGCDFPVSRHDVPEYYISRDLMLTAGSTSESNVPRFALQSPALEFELPSSDSLPPSTVAQILDLDLSRFQLQWCPESAINNDVIHIFSQGLYSMTYLSSKFALPKSRVVKVVCLGLTQAAKDFTLSQWATASSFFLEVARYSNAKYSFLVSYFVGFFSFSACYIIPPFFSGVFSSELHQRDEGSYRRGCESGGGSATGFGHCCVLSQPHLGACLYDQITSSGSHLFHHGILCRPHCHPLMFRRFTNYLGTSNETSSS